jgi:FKBP-type peptidyl-prolyl cis-trans isomerase 2
MHTAKLGDRVQIQYSRLPEHGAATEKSRGRNMFEFTVASSEVIPSLSLAILGMAQGETKRLMLQPPEAYGAVKPELIREVPRQRFPKHLVLRVGKRLTAVQKGSGRRRRVRVVEIKPHSVVLDGNHLLAGKVIELDVRLVSLDSSANANHRKPQFDLGGES